MLALLAASLLAVSCDSLSSDDDSASGAAVVQSEPNASPDGKAYLRVGISHGGAARTINPADVDPGELEDIVLSGTKSGSDSKQTLAEANSIADFPESVALDPGIWDFTLSARLGSAEYSAELTDIVIRKDETTSVTFSLESVAGQTQYGGLDFTLTLPDDSVKSAKITLKTLSDETVDEQTVSVSGASISYARSRDSESERLETGAYRLAISLYGDEFDGTNEPKLRLNTYKAVANIAAGRTSTGRDTLSGIEKIYSVTFNLNGGSWAGGAVVPESFTRKSSAIALPTYSDITRSGYGFAGWYTSADCGGEAVTEIVAGSTGNRKFYAKWIEPVLYVSESGDDSKDALSEENAVKTLARAVTLLKSYSADCGMGGEDWKICLKGSVSCGETMDIGTADAASLTVEGLRNSEESASQDYLLGTSEAAAITIASSVPVTFYKVCVKSGKGGIVAKGAGKLSVKNSAIMQNTGSGIKIMGDGDAEVYKSLIGGTDSTNGNTAENGAGIYKAGTGTLTITDSTIAYNTASGSGGGIYVNAGTLILSDGAKIQNNTAYSGGGIYVSSGSLTMTGGEISGNTAGSSSTCYGGGVYIGSSATFKMGGGKIYANSAYDGGGIATGNSTTGATIFLYGNATIGGTGAGEGNSANYGGGVWVSRANLYMGYSSETQQETWTGGIYNNTAAIHGGGIYYSEASSTSTYKTVLMASGTISGNSITGTGSLNGYGGGVNLNSNSILFTMSGGEISGNTANYGGGVYNKGTLTMSENAVISGNSANYGGGVYSAGTVTMSGSALIASDNDVYLPSEKYITVGGSLAQSTAATITLPAASYAVGTQVLDGTAELLASEYGKFAVSNTAWSIDSAGQLQKALTVTFNTNGGGTIAPQTVMSGNTATEPDAPTKTDYIFMGWYTSADAQLYDAAYDFGTAVTGDLTLYAKWWGTLKTGSEINAILKTLGANSTATAFAQSSTAPADSTAVQYLDNAENVPVWLDGTTIYYYAQGYTDATPKKKILLNANSASMFSGCNALETIDVTGFDTANVTNMYRMFSGCLALTTLDVSGFDTSKVSDMSSMFYNCNVLTALDVSDWDTSAVTTMSCMSFQCYKLTTLGADNVKHWNTTNVTNMNQMFRSCRELTALDVSSWNTTNVKDMSFTFYDCQVLTVLDVSGFDTSSVTTMHALFCNCYKLASLDVSNFNTSKVTNMRSMFSGCSALTELDVSGFDTSKVTTMESMFGSCTKLTTLDVSNFNTSKVTTTMSMFSYCSALTALDVSGFDTSSATSIEGMFYGCSSLAALDVSSFDTKNVTNMYRVFQYCRALTTLDLSNFDTSAVTSMREMFSGCSALTTIYASDKFTTTELVSGTETAGTSVFSGCSKLVGGAGTAYDSNNTDATYARIDTSDTPGYFTAKP